MSKILFWAQSATQWAETYFRLDELSNEVWWYQDDQGHCGNKTHFVVWYFLSFQKEPVCLLVLSVCWAAHGGHFNIHWEHAFWKMLLLQELIRILA